MNARQKAAGGAALLAALLLAPAQAFSQEEAGDPFDTGAFDATVAESQAPGGAATASFLAGGSLLVRASATLPEGLGGYAGGAGLSGRLFAKASLPDYGAFYVSYNASQAFLAALSGDGEPLLAPPADLEEPVLSLAELHWSFDLGKKVFLRLGKQLIAWGPSRVWTPVDFINRERGSSLQSLDLRAGKPGLRVHVPLDKANAFIFADFSDSVSGGTAQDPLDVVALAARLDATLGDFEFGLTGWAGGKVQDKLGLDFSGRLLGSSLYGELAFAPGMDQGESSLLASLGLSRNLGELKRLTLSGEFFYNSRGDDGSGAIVAPFTPLYKGRCYAYASLDAREFLSPDLATSLSALANLSDLSWTLGLKEGFSLPQAVPFSLGIAWNGGGDGKEFTYLAGDNSLSVTLEVRAEL